MKTMSILGAIFFSLTILTFSACEIPDEETIFDDAFIMGFLSSFFCLALSIMGIVYAKKMKTNSFSSNYTVELAKLGELKHKGVLTPEEFDNAKAKLLQNAY